MENIELLHKKIIVESQVPIIEQSPPVVSSEIVYANAD